MSIKFLVRLTSPWLWSCKRRMVRARVRISSQRSVIQENKDATGTALPQQGTTGLRVEDREVIATESQRPSSNESELQELQVEFEHTSSSGALTYKQKANSASRPPSYHLAECQDACCKYLGPLNITASQGQNRVIVARLGRKVGRGNTLSRIVRRDAGRAKNEAETGAFIG